MQSVSQVQNALLENNCRIFNLKKSVREDNTPLDLAVAIGGDGTFLRAAGWLLNRNLPLIGFNSDPGFYLTKVQYLKQTFKLWRVHILESVFKSKVS